MIESQLAQKTDRRETQFEMMFNGFDKSNEIYNKLLLSLEDFTDRFQNSNVAKEEKMSDQNKIDSGHLAKLDTRLSRYSYLNSKLERIVDRLNEIA